MKSADVYPSKWLAAADLGDQEPNVTIDRVLLEEISSTEKKPVIYFQGKKKGMICNKTNWKRIEHILGSDDSDDWSGHRIKLYVELVDMQGQMKPALRVRAPDKKQTATAQPQAVTERPGYVTSTAAGPRPTGGISDSQLRDDPKNDFHDDPIPF